MLHTLWVRHKEGTWDPNVEVRYEDFRKLHEEQFEKHGVDNLSFQEAYAEIMEVEFGYFEGLWPSPRPLRKGISA